ncbi:MAG TPA: hypothetical protein VF169_17070 [Albitalea sp.]
MMAAAEATSPNGTVVGAVFTFLLYGVMPLALVLYIGGAPARRRTRRAREDAEAAASAAVVPPDGSDHAPGDPVAPVRKEP